MKKYIQNVHIIVALMILGFAPIFQASAQTFTNLHSFAYTDGIYPQEALVITNGVLYGTTREGGSEEPGNDGTVFRLNSDGSGFTNIYSFTGGTDGGMIYSTLVLWGTTLFGEAIFGGASNNGCIFSIQTNGTGLYNIHSFDDDFFDTNVDGAYPVGGLVMVGNTLYGTTESGGTENWGSVFACNTNGLLFEFTNLLNFTVANGQYPGHGVIVSGSNIYGITGDGGTNGCGTIFSMQTDGTLYTNLYSFTADYYTSVHTNYDGAFPDCSLALVGNTLYGTTPEGGYFGSGTVFAINTDGSGFTVLHQFSATNGIASTNSDGAAPKSGLLYWDNALYGTTFQGGKSGSGTVFKVNLDGSGFTTVHNFGLMVTNPATEDDTNSDGANPLGSLIASGNTLYGTTSLGGQSGDGALYAISYPFKLNIALSGNNVVLFWPATDTGFDLQYATNLAPPVTWNTIPYFGTQNIVTNSVSNPQLFYRLWHP